MFRKLIVVHDQGKSPGPSCLTLAHLRSITSDADCCAGLAAMVQDVVDGNLTPAAADIICRGVSIGTDKGPMQVRPLTMPESIYKLAALFCLNSMDYAIPTLFPRIQLGVGIKGGPEIAIHRTQLALERGGPGTVVLRTDFRNAFNERDRAIIARALHGAPLTSGLWRFFMMAYGRRASHLGIYNRGQLIEHFLNSQGVRQGCPLASFLYALSVQPLYEQCVEGLSDVEAYAVADDLTLVGPARSVLAAFRRLIELSAPAGPALNLHKCEALWAYSTDHESYDEFADAMQEHGVTMKHDTVKMVGSTIGLGMARAAHCNAVVDEHKQFLAAIAHDEMPAQIALIITRMSYAPRLGYQARVTPPMVLREAAERFDEQILDCIATKLDLPSPRVDRKTLDLLRLPFKHFGLALRPHTLSSQRTSRRLHSPRTLSATRILLPPCTLPLKVLTRTST